MLVRPDVFFGDWVCSSRLGEAIHLLEFGHVIWLNTIGVAQYQFGCGLTVLSCWWRLMYSLVIGSAPAGWERLYICWNLVTSHSHAQDLLESFLSCFNLGFCQNSIRMGSLQYAKVVKTLLCDMWFFPRFKCDYQIYFAVFEYAITWSGWAGIPIGLLWFDDPGQFLFSPPGDPFMVLFHLFSCRLSLFPSVPNT
jgi:hypothetical protein